MNRGRRRETTQHIVPCSGGHPSALQINVHEGFAIIFPTWIAHPGRRLLITRLFPVTPKEIRPKAPLHPLLPLRCSAQRNRITPYSQCSKHARPPSHLTACCCLGLASSDAPAVHRRSTARGRRGSNGLHTSSHSSLYRHHTREKQKTACPPSHLTARCCLGLASSDAPTVHRGSTARGRRGSNGLSPLY